MSQSYIVEVSMGVVEHAGPYKTREEAQRFVDAFNREVAKRPNSEWWQMDATNHDVPYAHVIALAGRNPLTVLERHLADWELPI